jgi:NAD(P)-dependent dehydrogenase (short-subunit alcohol dehydrogenase family)
VRAFSLENDIALITGGGTGLGLGVARCFVEAGARVIIAGRREEPLESAVAELGPAASYEVYDVTEVHAADNLVNRIAERVGPVTILINNAGIHLRKRAEDTTVEEFQAVLDTHLLGAFALTRAVLPGMKARGSGSIVFMASMASIMGLPLVMAYSAAKSALLGMTRTMATELSGQGIRVNAIAPGWITTPMLERTVDIDPERKRRVLERTPMHVLGQPEDVGWAAVYLCSPAARFVTGILLPVDGGVSIGF